MLKMRHHVNSRTKIPISSSIPAVNHTAVPSRKFEESKPRIQQGISKPFNGNISNFTNQAHNVPSQNTNNIYIFKLKDLNKMIEEEDFLKLIIP